MNNNNLMNNDLSLTTQLIDQIENLNLGGEDKKLFEFINRMSDLNINNENKNQKNIFNLEENINNNNINNESINIELNEEKIKTISSKIINYNLHSLYYNKNSNNIIDLVSYIFRKKI